MKKDKLPIIKNETEDIARDSAAIKNMREYYEKLCKFDSLPKIKHQFLKTQNLPQVTQYEMDHLNSPITIKEIELVFKDTFKKKKKSSLQT